MKRNWGVVGIAIGLGLGLVAGTTMFADEPSGKEQGDPQSMLAEPLQVGIPKDTKFVEIEPARVFDSRQAGYTGSGLMAPNSSKVVYVGDAHNAAGALTTQNIVPTGATAIAYNLTVTGATGPNFVAVTPGDATSFTASAINFNGTSDVANAGIVSLDGARQLRIWNGDQTGSTHVIIDITGYFVKPLFAQVLPDGSLRNGSRVVSVERQQAGYYVVTFDRDVIDCGISAMIGQNTYFQAAAVIDFQTVNEAPRSVRVYTQNNDGANVVEDRGFSLVVTC